MRATDIASMKLTHLYSEVIGISFGAQPTGFTEWTGIFDESLLSISWDWIVLNDGRYKMPTDSMIRTNILLVDDSGYDVDPIATGRVCAARISALGWQDDLQMLLRKGD